MSHDLYTGITEQASQHQLDDARALFHAGRWRGAMYLSGYAVECLIKAKFMRIYDCWHLNELEDDFLAMQQSSHLIWSYCFN